MKDAQTDTRVGAMKLLHDGRISAMTSSTLYTPRTPFISAMQVYVRRPVGRYYASACCISPLHLDLSHPASRYPKLYGATEC